LELWDDSDCPNAFGPSIQCDERYAQYSGFSQLAIKLARFVLQPRHYTICDGNTDVLRNQPAARFVRRSTGDGFGGGGDGRGRSTGL